MDLSVEEIAELVGGTVSGDASIRIRGLNGLREAKPDDLSFFSDPKYAPHMAATEAGAVFVSEEIDKTSTALILVAEPYVAFVQMLNRFEEETLQHPQGIHPTASVHDEAKIAEGVALGPHAVVEAGATVGPGAVLYAGTYVGRDAEIGADTVLYPNVVVRERCRIGARCILHPNATIGGDGFGFAPVGGQQVKIPQVGIVVLEDDVEIGANSTVDRATAGATRIGKGTKIDSQVQVGHNTQIGEHCVISGCTGISGSAIIGNRVTIGGFSGIGGHLEIGDDVLIGGRSGVIGSLPAGSIVSGFPAADHGKVRRFLASRLRLPEALRRLRQLEKRVEELGKE